MSPFHHGVARLQEAEIKKRLKSANTWCHSVQNLLSSSLLSKSVKIKILQHYNLAGCFVWV
jgi:hypothetical protein